MPITQGIPIKRVSVKDASELPHNCCATPGGTLFSTTPGGTKIVYERSTLINLRNSPSSKTPPKWNIPDNIKKGANTNNNNTYSNNWNKKTAAWNNQKKSSNTANNAPQKYDDVQFQIEL